MVRAHLTLLLTLALLSVSRATSALPAEEPPSPAPAEAANKEGPREGELTSEAEAKGAGEGDLASEAEEEEVTPWSPASHRLFYKNAILSRTNPGGLQNGFELAYRYRLFESDELLFRDAFVGLAFKPMITPAFTRIGVSAQAQPLAVLYLEASWSWVAWYGVLGHPRTFADASGDYSDTGISEAAEAKGEPGATGGWELDLVAELRAKVGPVVIRNRTALIRSELTEAAPKMNPLFYDPLYDLLRPRSGWSMTNDADVLVYLLDEHLIVGARYSLAYAMWPGELGSEMNHRLGPLVAYRFFMEPGAAFDQPTAIALIQWHLEHPHRSGADVSQAIPYLVIGFAFQGDLL